MTFEQKFVVAKLNELNVYAKELAEVLKLNDENILKDLDKLRHAERAFQLTVDTMLDINQHFIKELKLPVYSDFQSTFYLLGEKGVLPKTFSDKLAPIVGLRNRIVHRYESINRRVFVKELRKNFGDFQKYADLISKYLNKKK